MEARGLELFVGFIDRIIHLFGVSDPAEFEFGFG